MKTEVRYACIAAGAIFSFCLTGCQTEETFVPVTEGEEITFGSSLPGAVSTKTIYGDEIVTDGTGRRYYPVYWADNDCIAVYCPESSNTVRADYMITPAKDTDGNPTNTSAAVTKTGEVGLQWGSASKHNFYGFYPAKAVSGVDGDGLIQASVPVLQDPVRFEESTVDGHKVIRGIANTDYAYMWAYTQVDKDKMEAGTDVPLTFHPLNTILEITINGPATNSAPIKISSININAVDPDGAGQNIYLTGDFECDFTGIKDGTGTTPTCEISGNLSEVRNRITISCYDEAKKDFIELAPGDKLVLQAYLLPNDDGFEKQTLQISVSPLNSANLVKTLQTDQILAHKVNLVSLPALKTGGTNYWMDSLDPTIYITELSLPGSKFSILTEANNSNIIYQNATIQQQFNTGVRAFIVQTGALYDARIIGGFREGELYACVDSRRLDNVRDIIKELGECIDNAHAEGKDNEYVFLQLTFDGGATDNQAVNWSYGDERGWIETVEYAVKEYCKDSELGKYIYQDEILPTTTIDDVKGKIVLKVNYNNTTMGNYIPANSGVPCLFSLWKTAYVEGGVPMKWGSSNVNRQTELTWLYQEVTTVGMDGTGLGEEGPNGNTSLSDKKQYVSYLFTESVKAYQENKDFSTWFMNDLGGCLVGRPYSNSLSSEGVVALTKEMSVFAVQQLQERSENASLGLIFFNFADNLPESGQEYGTASLIQTVVDNNFKFALRKDSPSAGTAASRPVTRSSDGWDE